MSALSGLNPGLWFEEAGRLRALEGRLLKLWEGQGFREVIPPLLLPCEPAQAASPQVLVQRTLRVPVNGDGQLALRSDFTAGVAWMVARRSASLSEPLRVFYSGGVLRRPTPDRPEGMETLQAGCERIAPDGEGEGDGEMVHLAAESLAALDLEGAILELGHWGLVGPLLERIPWPSGAREALESAINRKSVPAVEDLAARHGRTPEVDLLKDLLHLGGRPEAVDALAPRLREAGVLAVWEELRAVGALTARDFPGVAVRLEPTDIRHWSYYTGITVKAFAPSQPYAVLSGGRYDNLYPSLGRPFGAFGFAVHLGRLLEGV